MQVMTRSHAIRRLFIANRGEIAVRIIHTCKRLGIESILGASAADLQSTAARLADHTTCIGPAPAAASYLNIGAVLDAARAAEADAMHPGYGFLAENAALARACREAGIVFIGPTEEHLAAIGDKLEARRHAAAAGIPIAPGGSIASIAQAQSLAQQIGYPVLIKAVGGGGGRGMKQVHEPSQLPALLELAVAEANSAFGDARVYLERFIARARHVEVQLLGDGEQVVHLGTRDCSVQRRYQKLIEEAPAPDLSDSLRAAIHEAAVRFGVRLRYRGAGTVEFLVDRAREEFYFLEMNARIQVEHPVTEMVSGMDIVAAQIAIAERPLKLRQEDISIQGHSIECRINAEDVSRDFRPSPGKVSVAAFPAGEHIRVDTHIESGSDVPPFYDSLLAKIIAHGDDRAACCEYMKAALGNCRIEGVDTNHALHAALIQHPDFVRGGVDTSFLAGTTLV
jgi:acetyl-CoA carboxylase, biotin carboxylase subunit